MGPDSRHGPCLHCSPVFGGGLGTPSLQGAEGPCGHFRLSPHPPRSWRCRSGPGQQGSAPSSAQLDPFSWAPIPFGGTRSCHRQPGRSGRSPGTWLMPVRAPVSAAAAWCEAVPTAPVAAPRPLGGGGLRATAGLGGRGHGRLCDGTSQGECLLLVTCVSPSVLPRPGAEGAGGRPQSHGPGSVSVPKCPVLL